jgi:hypothetical protein
MSNHTAQDLLAAVGVDWKVDPKFYAWDNSLTSTQIYTGPALGTPELDAVLWVEGQFKCREIWGSFDDIRDRLYAQMALDPDAPDVRVFEWLMAICPFPGHALAAAIKEVEG